MNRVINGLIFENGKVLVIKKKDIYILPGEKPKIGELYFDCLNREFKEELSNTNIEIENFYKSFSGINPFSQKYFTTDVYFCKLVGNLGNPSAEISGKKYISKSDFLFGSIPFSQVTENILERLTEEGYLKDDKQNIDRKL